MNRNLPLASAAIILGRSKPGTDSFAAALKACAGALRRERERHREALLSRQRSTPSRRGRRVRER
jgi:hypothetical protein